MNEREIQSLLALAAKRLHTTPEALRAAPAGKVNGGIAAGKCGNVN